jgi:hypothetical protein
MNGDIAFPDNYWTTLSESSDIIFMCHERMAVLLFLITNRKRYREAFQLFQLFLV